jgi:hypothetical protein
VYLHNSFGCSMYTFIINIDKLAAIIERKAMIRIFLILITSVLLYSCKESNPSKTLNALSIEVYYDNSWTASGTTNVEKAGITRLVKCDLEDSYQRLRFYRDTLKTNEIDSLNKYLDSIRFEKIDSEYYHNCNDCGFIIIKIIYPDTIFNTRINGRNKFNNNISKLARFILNSPPTIENPADSSFNFELRKYLRLVPPPPGIK